MKIVGEMRRLGLLLGIVASAALLTGCPMKKIERTDETPSPAPEQTSVLTPATPPQPTPIPTPTPIYVPSKRMETAKLFSGLEVHTTVQADFGSTATIERNTPASYVLDLQLTVRVPRAHTTLDELAALNPELPKLLPGLGGMLGSAQVSPFFDDLYARKVATLNRDLPRLDQLISRHNFYDCETLLNMQSAPGGRRVVLMQADMDVCMDGSDGDRVPITDGNTANFQATTSYKWPKRTEVPNSFLAQRESALAKAEAEVVAPGTPPQRAQTLRGSLPNLRAQVDEVKRSSFLVAATDPYIVLPGPLIAAAGEFAPKLGDFCVVIAGNRLYPAIVGDVGPTYKTGEASYRLCKEINARASAYSRPVDDLKATYIVFPGTATKPFGPPDLAAWHKRCQQLLGEIGGFTGELVAWVDLTVPSPAPTPVPAASPAASASASAANSPVPAASSSPVAAATRP